MRWVVVAVAVLLGGCLQAEQPSATEPTATTEPTPERESGSSHDERRLVATSPGIEVYVVPFMVESAGPKGAPGFQAQQEVPADDNVTALVVELEWTGAFDLDPYLSRTDLPGCLATPTGCAESFTAHYLDEGDDGNYWNKGGRFGSPDSPASIQVSTEAYHSYDCAAEGCAWQARVQAKEAAVDVSGVLYVSVFRGVEIPAGYTAIGTVPVA
ncbi:MAG: hypothetical protein ACYC2H_02205 [Thermoplasmatota archaeon]